jgi:hypothetical membrane protein
MAFCKKGTEENAIATQTKLNMRKSDKNNWLIVAGTILILIGATSIFPENGTWLHTFLQIIFVVGCILLVIGGRLSKKMSCSIIGLALMLSISFPTDLNAQDYSKQIKAFEESFTNKLGTK